MPPAESTSARLPAADPERSDLSKLLKMRFDPSRYGPDVESVLALDGAGERLLPLQLGPCTSEPTRLLLKTKSAREWFPQGSAPDAALSGLWLYFSCFEEAHGLAQDIHTPEGSYWHGILHRLEPDPANAGYWFRRVGEHPTFPKLRDAAAAIAAGGEAGFAAGQHWDPFVFIDFCEQARKRPGSAAERCAREIQRAEWQILFDYCAGPR